MWLSAVFSSITVQLQILIISLFWRIYPWFVFHSYYNWSVLCHTNRAKEQHVEIMPASIQLLYVTSGLWTNITRRGRERERGGGKWKKVRKKERGSICQVFSQEFLLIQNWVLRIPVELLTRLEVKAHRFRASSSLKAIAVYHQLNLQLKCWWFSYLWFMADSSPLNQSSHIYSHPLSLNLFQTVRALMVQFSSDLCQIHIAFSIFQLVHII